MNRCREAGVTLIEVLVAVLVLAIGMIGTVGLQGVAKYGNFEALQRTQAVLIARDIAERMSANRQLNTLDDYIGTYNGKSFSSSPKSCLGSTANCSPAELADWDTYQFDLAILGVSQVIDGKNVGNMVDAVGCIFVNGGEVTVAISWQGKPLAKAVDTSNANAPPVCGSNSVERRQYTLTTFIEELG